MRLIKALLLLVLLAIAAGGGAFLWAYKIEPNRLIVREKTVEAAVDAPVKIVFWSDLHLGEWYTQEKLEQIVEKINAQQADLVIFGGDFFNHYAADQELLSLEEIAGELQKIEAPLGKYAVWGNHDYGGGSYAVYPEVMEAGGFVLLKNERIELPEQKMESVKVENVHLTDYFPPEQTLEHFMRSDVIFNLYGNHTPLLDFALSNKLYFAAKFCRPILVCPDTYMEKVSKGFGYTMDLDAPHIADDFYSYYSTIEKDKMLKACDEFLEEVLKENEIFNRQVETFLR